MSEAIKQTPPTITPPPVVHPPKPPKPHKNPGYCGVIVVAIIVGLITSLVFGFASSGLGKIAVEKLRGQQIEKLQIVRAHV